MSGAPRSRPEPGSAEGPGPGVGPGRVVEAEHRIRAEFSVRDCVVARSAERPARLVAYVVPGHGTRISRATLRRRLQKHLPAAAVPDELVLVADLPRHGDGDVDLDALPSAAARAPEPVRSRTEAVLASIWATALGLTNVGRDEDFFALGGDLLGASEVMLAVAATLGVALADSDLLAATRLSRLAERIDSGLRPPGHARVVPVGDVASGPAVFCLPGAGSSPIAFAPLTRLLGPDAAVYVLQSRGYEDRRPAEWRFRAMVRRRVREIRRQRPHGPYIVVGHSLGAHVAHEVGATLHAAGEEVKVVLLDPFLVETRLGRVYRDGHPRLDELVLKPADRAGLPWWRVGWELGRRAWRYPLTGLVPMRRAALEGQLYVIGYAAMQRSSPRRLECPALVYRTEDNGDPQELWDELVPRRVVDRRLRCDHVGILRSPQVEQVAADVRAVLAGQVPEDALAGVTARMKRSATPREPCDAWSRLSLRNLERSRA